MFKGKTQFYVLSALILLCALTVPRAQAESQKSGDDAPGLYAVNPDKDIRMKDLNDAKVPPDAVPFAAMQAVQAMAATGDYRIDSLLSGYKWSVGTITYSFYSDAVFGGQYYGSETVSEVSPGIKANVRQIMAWYSTLINIPIVEVTETSNNIGLIRFMLSNGPSYAYAYYPSSSTMFSLAGDVHLRSTYDHATDTNGFQNPAGKHGYVALVHEIGHTLGLKHPFDSTPNLPATEDNDSFTVMTYTWPYSSEPGTPMTYDLMALQYLYSAKTNRTGNDSYAFTSRGLDQYNLGSTLYINTPYSTRQTVWDSGGFNTLDLTGLPAATGYRIDMRELGWLSRTADYNATGIHFAKGIALGQGVALRDIVNSGSGDDIYANPQPNVFKGYSKTRVTGADKIYLASLDDILDLSGYSASEVTSTQSGNDRVLGLGANGSITIKDYYLGYTPQVTFSTVMPSFSISDASVTEGNSSQVAMTFTVTLSSATSDVLTVHYATSDVSATAGSDYVAASGTLTFAANETTKTFTVFVNGDNNIESNETFSVSLSIAANSTNPSSPPGISDALATGTIVNDDVNQPPVANAVITSQSGTVAPATVVFSSVGSSDPEGSTLTYSWNFGDGTALSTGANPSHTYTKGGTYTAVLTVTDTAGAKGTDSVTVALTDPPLTIAGMTPQGGTVARNATVNITATVKQGDTFVSGATVVFSMTKTGTKKATRKTAVTNASGVAMWSYTVARRDPLGLYNVTATATLGSQSANSQPPHAYFTVQ
jgi:serralysin